MKTIVFLSDGTMHSAWHSVEEAKHQVEVLVGTGYKGRNGKRGPYYLEIDHNYSNGHYFV